MEALLERMVELMEENKDLQTRVSALEAKVNNNESGGSSSKFTKKD